MSLESINFKGRSIRDNIHGDIFLPLKYIEIIDTPEFQRLRRIHQLSVGYLLFPGADHTRFSHSIGTYHVMEEIIDHFEEVFSEIKYSITKEDRELALVSALLHDIGHGPFSHAFEDAMNTKHEDWTVKIIEDESNNINKVLKKNFGDDFPRKVANLIRDNNEYKKTKVDSNSELNDSSIQNIDLHSVLKSLISSQLDADRMDYLLRDSYFTGVTSGKVDLSRLIRSMTITERENKIYVCMYKKYLRDIEEYLLARYHMNEGVYLHDFKCGMELIIGKILKRAEELYKKGDLLIKNNLPNAIKSVFDSKQINIRDYCSIDDVVLLSVFMKWKESGDAILSELCKVLVDRKKYKKLRILNNNPKDIINFKTTLKDILGKYGYKSSNLEDEYFWIESEQKFDIYKSKKENLWILDEDGVIKDIINVSNIISKGDTGGTRLKDIKRATFINYSILEMLMESETENLAIEEVKTLVKGYDSRENIEIEKKYNLESEKILTKTEEYINTINDSINYEVIPKKIKLQIDDYYDTKDNKLNENNCTLRIRKLKNEDGTEKKLLTLKTPVPFGQNKESSNDQNERFEKEILIDFNDLLGIETNHINMIPDYMLENIPELKDINFWKNLDKSLSIENTRKKYIVKYYEDIEFEVALDNLKYLKSDNKGDVFKKDYQVEIELKSDYIHRVNLKRFTDELEKEVCELEPTKESKYKRALNLLDII